jgi:hypothetical protein
VDALRQIAIDAACVTYDDREPGVELPPPDMQAALANAETLFRYTVLAVCCQRLNIAWSRLSIVEHREIELTQAGGIGQDVHLDNLALPDRERDDRE